MTLVRSISGIFSGLLFVSLSASAQPNRDRILDDIHIADKGACSEIQVAFTFPIRYVKHFPFENGDELHIQLEPISISPLEQEAIFDRESLRPPNHKNLPLDEVVYEGDIEGGHYVTLFFTESVAYEVGQGADFRSLLISVRDPHPAPGAPACPHLPKPEK